jgi:hypothetical protein
MEALSPVIPCTDVHFRNTRMEFTAFFQVNGTPLPSIGIFL